MYEWNKKKSLVIALIVAAILVIIGVILFQKNDKKAEALLGAKEYFTLTEDKYFNEYFAYKTFYKESIKKDTVMEGKLQEKVAGVTIEASFVSNIDKKNKMVDNQWSIGLGGMPFATVQTITDQDNVYFVSDLFQDKVPYINYTGDMSAWDGKLGLNNRNIRVLQKGYAGLFDQMVSTNSYGSLEMLWDNKTLSYDFIQMYKNLTVEKSKSENEYSGYQYTIVIPTEDMNNFLADLKKEFPEYESQGYINIISKFVSTEQGLVIEEEMDKNGKVISLKIENKENGYCAQTEKSAQEKEGKTGFQESLTLNITKGEESYVDGQCSIDYSTEDNKVYFSATEKKSGCMVDCTAILSLKAGEKKFSLVFDDIKFKLGDVKLDMTGNLQMAYGDYPASVPGGDKIDLVNGSEEDMKELNSQIKKSLGGIVSGALSSILGF